MLDSTNIKKIQELAIVFLNMDIKLNEYSPLVIDHPFFESGYIPNPDSKNDKYEIVNICEDLDGWHRIVKSYSEIINSINSASRLYNMVRKSYRFTFFKYTKDFLNISDYSSFLGEIWTVSENPNNDANVSLKEAERYFLKADKKYLMEEEELAFYNNLKNEFVVYRGVALNRNPKGMSWTTNYEKAVWFANRFNKNDEKGYVQKGIVLKKNILACFLRRGEEEIVVPFKHIKNLEKV